jgi:PilZ domain
MRGARRGISGIWYCLLPGTTAFHPDSACIWPPRCLDTTRADARGCQTLKPNTRLRERRRWPRLPLAIPVFLRSQSEADKELLEFATALNLSGGGMLIATRRAVQPSSEVLIEIPSSPMFAPETLPHAVRKIPASALRTQTGESCNLVAFRFLTPLISEKVPAKPLRRRQPASV